MSIDVSIVIINYNTFQLACSCIKSVLEKTRGIRPEIILIDNGSSERDPEDFKKLFPEIILIKSPGNVGFARGNNLGIQRARGKYVLLLNSDTVLKNNAVTICKNFLEDNSNVAVAASRLEYPDGCIQHSCQRFPSVPALLFELFRLQKLFPLIKKKLFGPFFDYRSVAYPDWVWGTFFMFRKDLLDKLPGQKLSDDFFMYVEDMQWCREFKRIGYKTVFLPSAHVVHFMGGSGGQKSVLMRQNLDAFMISYYPRWQRLLIRLLNFFLTGRYGH